MNDDRVSPWWRGAAIAASLLAAIGGAAALRPSEAPVPAGVGYVAAVTARGREPALLVTIDARTGRALVRAIGLTPPERHSLELWYIGPGRDPRSLGLVSGDMRAEMPLGRMMRGDAPSAAMFAVSVEPEGGAPAGRPTGEILYTGRPMAISGT